METKRTEGAQVIGHDWERIKNSTDRYKVTRMEIKVFKYKIIEELNSGVERNLDN